jgi:hypothetical protein
MNKFRPQEYYKKHKYRSIGQYNWIKCYDLTLDNYLNRIEGILHYRHYHAPKPIRLKWHSAWLRMERRRYSKKDRV